MKTPVLLIGLGGVGCEVVCHTQKMFRERFGSQHRLACLGIDYEDHIGIPVFRDFEVGDASNMARTYFDRDPYFPQHWLTQKGKPYAYTGAIGRNSAAGQIRANGRLAAIVNLENAGGGIRAQLDSFLRAQGVIDAERAGDPNIQGYYVIVICSMGGGTGSGILHEVVFAIRDELKVQDSLIGLFLDGTVVKTWAPRKTGPMGYATLVEIEHWMARAQDYYDIPLHAHYETRWQEMRNRKNGGLRLEDLKYLDFALLVSRENSNKKLLTGERTGTPKGDYANLAAGWLYAFLVGEFVIPSVGKADGGIKDSGSRSAKLTENVLNVFRNRTLLSDRGRAYGYGSIGVSMLTVPIEKISRYLSASIILEFLNEYQQKGQMDSSAEQYLEERNLDELIGGKLSSSLRSESPEFKKLSVRLVGVQREIERSNNYDKVIKAIKSFNLSTPEAYWQGDVEAYTRGLEGLVAKKLTVALGDLDKIIAEKLGSIAPARVADWLDQLAARLQKCMDSTDRTAHQQSGSWIQDLKKHTNEISQYSTYQRWMKWDDAKLMIRQDLTKLQNELIRIEAVTLKNQFYSSFKSAVGARTQCVRLLQQQLEELAVDEKQAQANFTTRQWYIDESKLRANHHPLELEIGTHQKFVLGAKSALQGDKYKVGLLDRIQRPGDIPGEQRMWSGFGYYYAQLLGEYQRAVADPSLPTEIESIKSDLRTSLQAVFTSTVFTDVENLLSSSCDISQAVDSFLDLRFDDAKEFDDSRVESKEVRHNFEVHFGVDGTRDLLPAGNLKREVWKQKALVLMISRIASFSAPFWQQNEERRHEAEHVDGNIAATHRHIFCPSEEIRKILLRNQTPELKPFNLADFADRHSIAAIQLAVGYPLNTVIGYEEDRSEYIQHREKWLNARESVPYHVDQRFYTKWRDDIMSLEAPASAQKELITRAYLLGIGCGVLTMTEKGTRRYGLNDKRLATGLPALLKTLRDDHDLLTRLREETVQAIGAKLVDASVGKQAAMEEVWSIFLKGYKAHEGAKPPKVEKNPEGYIAWEEIAEAGKIRKRSDGSWDHAGEIIPVTKEDFERLYAMLKV